MSDVERCIYCGQAIPEGKQICPDCELSITRTAARIKNKRYKKRMTAERLKRIVIAFMLISAIIGAGIGTLITYICKTNPKDKDAGAATNTSSAPLYGTRDGKIFVSEMSLDWADDLNFTPIDCALPEDLQEYTYYIATGYYIDFSFVMGLMYCESSFRTDCISGSNDYGLMQINEQNHSWLKEQLGLTDISEPHQNIRAGLFMLRKLFEKYDDPSMVAMAYNMGEYGASLLWKKGEYHTQYSNKVLKKANEYKEQLENSIKK